MDLTAGCALRWSRALVLGTVVLGFGTVAHASAGGQLPGSPALLTAWGLSVLVSATLLERPAGTALVVSLTVAGQTLVHAWLTLTAGHGGAHAGTTDPLAHLMADLAPANAPMMLAHTLAAAAVGLWLAAGEQALWAVLAVAGAALVVLLGRPLGVPLRPDLAEIPAAPVHPRPRLLRFLGASVVRRGPPVLLTA